MIIVSFYSGVLIYEQLVVEPVETTLRQAQGPHLVVEPVETTLRQAQGPQLVVEPVETTLRQAQCPWIASVFKINLKSLITNLQSSAHFHQQRLQLLHPFCQSHEEAFTKIWLLFQ